MQPVHAHQRQIAECKHDVLLSPTRDPQETALVNHYIALIMSGSCIFRHSLAKKLLRTLSRLIPVMMMLTRTAKLK